MPHVWNVEPAVQSTSQTARLESWLSRGDDVGNRVLPNWISFKSLKGTTPLFMNPDLFALAFADYFTKLTQRNTTLDETIQFRRPNLSYCFQGEVY